MLVVAILFGLSFSLPAQTTFDLVIHGARVVDGAGNPYFFADIGVSGDTIAALGNLTGKPARLRIDANGLTVTPGFIDIHNHSYPDILSEPTAAPYLFQGVTTLIGAPDGSGPLPVKAALDKLAANKMSVNMALCVGHGSVRRAVMNMENRAPTPAELDRMRAITKQAMLEGAVGLSTGLFYTPANFAKTEEVIEIAKVVAQYNGFHVSHI